MVRGRIKPNVLQQPIDHKSCRRERFSDYGDFGAYDPDNYDSTAHKKVTRKYMTRNGQLANRSALLKGRLRGRHRVDILISATTSVFAALSYPVAAVFSYVSRVASLVCQCRSRNELANG
jgi:hypothetical protein